MQKQVIINNVLINYYVDEKNSTASIIFLHGWRSNSAVWQPLINKIKDLRFKIYEIDLPGFGMSETPKKPFTLDDYANVIKSFIDLRFKIQDSRIIVVGHSFGARVATKLAATHPKLIQKLVLVDAGGARPKGRKVKQFLAKLARPFFTPSFMQPLRKKIYQKMGAEDYIATPELKQTFLNVINEDLAPLFPKIAAPTLIVWGENDTETPISYAHMMHTAIPHSQLAILPNAGHFSFLDQPEKFINALTKFII